MTQPDSPPQLASARVTEGEHGRVVELEGTGGKATVREFGAHVTSWVPADGRGEALFVSDRARLDGRTAIRGGVPVIFPQFGPGPMPKHGFARTHRWVLADAGLDGDGVPHARFAMHDDARTRELWPYRFAAELTVTLDERLAITLAVTNTGEETLDFTAALHTYLRVRDVAHARVRGLEGARMRDKLTRVEMTEGRTPVAVLGAVDRVYLDVPDTLRVVDELAGRTLRVETSGFPDAVLWNPWEEGARELEDLADDEYHVMLCLEPAVVATPVRLAPGEQWTGVQRLGVD